MHLETVANSAVKPGPGLLGPILRVPAAMVARFVTSTLVNKSAGEVLFSEGDDADSIYEVTGGMLRLCKLLPDGRRQITGFATTGHFLGLAPEDVCVYAAEAITRVTLRRYKRSAFDRLIDEVPGFARRILAVASHELRAAQDQMLLLGRKGATERVASFLIMIANQQASGGDKLDIPMTRSDIGDYLGLSLETVSRTLSKLRQDGLIALSTAVHIEILHRERLKAMAAGAPDAQRETATHWTRPRTPPPPP